MFMYIFYPNQFNWWLLYEGWCCKLCILCTILCIFSTRIYLWLKKKEEKKHNLQKTGGKLNNVAHEILSLLIFTYCIFNPNKGQRKIHSLDVRCAESTRSFLSKNQLSILRKDDEVKWRSWQRKDWQIQAAPEQTSQRHKTSETEHKPKLLADRSSHHKEVHVGQWMQTRQNESLIYSAQLQSHIEQKSPAWLNHNLISSKRHGLQLDCDVGMLQKGVKGKKWAGNGTRWKRNCE